MQLEDKVENREPGPADGNGGSRPIAPERLRDTADLVRDAFPRPASTPELVLIDVDPYRLHAFWALPPSAVETARASLGSAGGDAPLVLRIATDDAPGGEDEVFDTEVAGLQGKSYIDVWSEARRYHGFLGLRRPDGSLETLAASAPIDLPRLGPATDDASRSAAPPPTAGTPAEAPQAAAAAPAPTAADSPEPVPHPFPHPPSESAGFDPTALTGRAAPGKTSPTPAATERPKAAVSVELGLATTDIAAAEPTAAPPPAPYDAEPVRHPFPLPPTEPGEFVPEAMVSPSTIQPTAPAAGAPHDPLAASVALIGATPEAAPALPGAAFLDAEPVRHPFPLPPTEPGEFVPEFLGGGTPGGAPGHLPEGEQPSEAPPLASGSADAPAAGGETLAALPLENVLAVSSYALGQETVELEINAEIHIFGRTRVGNQLQLFGRKVMVRPDGTFSVVRPLPNGALVLSALLVNNEQAD